jgi:ribosomal protein S18 acetylase RimI-like enzyme
VTFTIRRATSSDAAAILNCLRSAFAQFESSYTAAGYRDTVLSPETVQDRLNSMSVFVAVNDSGEVVGTIGCAAAEGGEGHLRGMAVLPDWQGSGVAEQLLKRAESELQEKGCNRVTLDTTAPLERAVSFYKKNGYMATGRVTDFFGMPLYEYEKQLGKQW